MLERTPDDSEVQRSHSTESFVSFAGRLDLTCNMVLNRPGAHVVEHSVNDIYDRSGH